MGFVGVLFFVIIQLLFFSGLVLIWMKMKREYSDDSRWSRNLQILQSKIAVFEDLSDRTETQVNQLTIMLENKMCDLQRKIDEADEILNKISSSMKKSMEVAQIFQDKIPHEEIIERQNTVKFVKAALLANSGKTVAEISEAINLPKSQIEFIVKVNSQRLSFDPQQMPDWLKLEIEKEKLNVGNGSVQQRTSLWRSPLRPLNQLVNQKINFLESEQTADDLSSEFLQNEIEKNKESISKIENQNISSQSAPIQSSPTHLELNKTSSSQTELNQRASGTQFPYNNKELMESRRVKDISVRPVVFPRIEKPSKNMST